jgi:two-component system, NarL family, sensor histidine kinase UhpB
LNAHVGEVVSGSLQQRLPWARWLAIAGVLVVWQLVFWPVVHLAERAARPPEMDARAAVAYQLLAADGTAIPGASELHASRSDAPVAYYIKPGADAARVRFLVPFVVEDAAKPLALFLGVRNSVDVIRVNGELIQSLAPLPKLKGLVTSEPAFVPLPAEHLETGSNLLAIETPNFGSQWLAEFAIGPADELASAFRWKNLLQTDLALVGLAILMFAILLCVVVRWPEPDRARIRALVVLLATCAASTYLLTFSPPVPLSVGVTVYLYTLSSYFIALAILSYVLLGITRAAGWRRHLRWAWAVLPLLSAAPIAGAQLIGPLGPWLGQALRASFWVVVVVGTVSLVLLAHALVREKGARWFERSMLAFCIAAFVMDRLGSIVPLYSPLDASMQLTLGWSQIVGGLLGLSVVVALAREATEARRVVLTANDRLVSRLAEREAELRAVHQREQETQRRAVLLEERQRIVRDMHDGIGGQLLGLALQARGPGVDARELADGLDASLLDLRLIIDSMDTAESGLAESVMAFAHRVRPQVQAAGLTLELDNELQPGDPVIGSRSTLHVLRVLQEAVANALRHAGARTLRIEARRGEEGVVLQVSDDGRGMPAQAIPGRGLANMRARLASLGGSIEIGDATPGTRVRLVLPQQALAGSAV